MHSIQLLSPSRHRTLRWHRAQNYAFAADRTLVGLAAAELTQGALAFPLAFTRAGNDWSLCALLGLLPGQNLYVDAQGGWRGAYVPATLRVHPFHLGWDATAGATLCLDEASGLFTQDDSGELIFENAGGLSASVAQIWTFLTKTAESILALEQVCGLLAEVSVLAPWPITFKTQGGEQSVPGLYRLNEAALNGLDDDAFARLRRSGGLPVAYAQLLSMGNLKQLAEMAQARVQAEAAERARAEVKPMVMLPLDSTIDWDWSKIGR